MVDFNPGLIMVLGGLLVPLLSSSVRRVVLLALPIAGLTYVISLQVGTTVTADFMGYTLEVLRVDKLTLLWGYVFHIAAFLGVLYAIHEDDPVQAAMAQIYMGSAVAAVFAGDLITLFIFWELTAISSVFLIWASGTERSFHAGMRYLVVQIGSGVLLLAGAVIIFAETGSIHFGHIGVETFGGKLVLVAFGIKCAFPLLHNWLQDAYPEATVSGTVILSAFTTKLAVYALARGFAGTEFLIYIGATMTAFPIFFAVIENNLRRVLAYSLNNQLGFMVVGIGVGTELAINGAAGHAFAHIIYKALLFMTMGAVLMRTGTINGSDLGGLYKTMPWTTGFCIIGAASISSFPLMSGFVTKSMILTALGVEGYWFIWAILLFASAGVFHHSGIKIPYFAFFAHDSGMRPKEAPFNMRFSMGIAAFLCIAVGVYPAPLYAILPFDVDYIPYSPAHVITQLQLLMFSALAFTFLMLTGLYPPELKSTNLDTDWFYRRLAPKFFLSITTTIQRVNQRGRRILVGTFDTIIRLLDRYSSMQVVFIWINSASTMVFCALVLLCFFLILFLTSI
ncbi:MAG: Na(+)/H(+) antiporter subunit D [Magnetovibrio sp.]|mgnify:CR=1 FL=1|nr:Na(+)/H(+) antiporter subunit D [Magnetovibrio sp.]|tara:strand:- start:3570 stop:5264 length:1695 start_codon:yes stop_codon:yes gene_type:complete